MTKTEIINETAKFYNLSNRGYNEDENQCHYLTDDGKKCAVGRCISPEKLIFFNDLHQNEGVGAVSDLQEFLVEGYAGHSIEFWKDLQIFHDRKRYWDEDGLTVAGHLEHEVLLARYGRFKDYDALRHDKN